MELSLMAAQHFPAISGAFMDSPLNGNASLQISTSNLNANLSRPAEQEEESKYSSDVIWLWVAVFATIGNILVVAVAHQGPPAPGRITPTQGLLKQCPDMSYGGLYFVCGNESMAMGAAGPFPSQAAVAHRVRDHSCSFCEGKCGKST